MKIITMDLDSIILFLSDMDFSLEEDILELENKFRDIFLRLKKLYNIDIEGYYKIDIYVDNFIGVIVDIEREDFEYFEYSDNQVDMHISIHNNEFILIEIDDIYVLPDKFLEKVLYYNYDNKFYINIIEPLSVSERAEILEISNSILYGSLAKYIIKK